VKQAITNATPTSVGHAAIVQPRTSAKTVVAFAKGGERVTVPTDPTDGIKLSSDSGSFTVHLPNARNANHAEAVSDGTVAYDNKDDSFTVPVVVSDGSVQINTVIESAAAPSTFKYTFDLPPGGSIVAGSKGSYTIVDGGGGWVAGIAPAWAKDANGVDLKTSYVVDGSTLVQVVAVPKDAAYPIVADPWLGFDTIDHTKWVNTWQYSPTLQVFPTWWGRYTGVAANGEAWNEVVSKTSTNRSSVTTAAMRVQFDCHWYAVRVYAPNKPSWDLDTKLPNTSLANEINYGCNYPSGKREF